MLVVVLSAAMSHASEFEADHAASARSSRAPRSGSWSWGPDGLATRPTPPSRRCSAYPPAELSVTSFRDYTHPDDVETKRLALFARDDERPAATPTRWRSATATAAAQVLWAQHTRRSRT